MKMIKHSRFLVCALVSAGVLGGAIAQDSSEQIDLEQAKTALEEAKSALESAQDTLSKAQQAEEKLTPAPIVAQKPKAPARLYKWVDENGNISYQDSPPPKTAKVINSDVLKDQPKGDQPVKELRKANQPAPVFDGDSPVMVYTADNCKPCQSVVLFLTQNQVPFIERDIRSDRRARDRLSKQSKQISVPSLFIGERIIQGHAKPMIRRALEEAGYLDPQ